MYPKEVRLTLSKLIFECIEKANRGEAIHLPLNRIPTLHIRIRLPEYNDLLAVVNLLENWVEALNNISEVLPNARDIKVNYAERLLYQAAEQLKKNQEIKDPEILKFAKTPVEKGIFYESHSVMYALWKKLKSQ